MAGDRDSHYYEVEVRGTVLVYLPAGSDDAAIHAAAMRQAEDGYINAETSLICAEVDESEAVA